MISEHWKCYLVVVEQIYRIRNAFGWVKKYETRPPPAEAASGQAFSGNPAGALGAAAHGLMFEMYTLVSMCLKKWKCNYCQSYN